MIEQPTFRLVRSGLVVLALSLPAATRVDAQPQSPPPAQAIGDSMVPVPEGGFTMGCDPAANDPACDPDPEWGEVPLRKVEVSAFSIDRTEVRVADFRRCVEAGACGQPIRSSHCNWSTPNHVNHPINCVHAREAEAYCAWAGKRLPTEVEWEKAARGTDGRKYPWGNDAFGRDRKLANIVESRVHEDGFRHTAPVGSFPAGASPYGVLDMIGNVYEWTATWYTNERVSRVVRGGAFNFDPDQVATWSRRADLTNNRNRYVGFRCAK